MNARQFLPSELRPSCIDLLLQSEPIRTSPHQVQNVWMLTLPNHSLDRFALNTSWGHRWSQASQVSQCSTSITKYFPCRSSSIASEALLRTRSACHGYSQITQSGPGLRIITYRSALEVLSVLDNPPTTAQQRQSGVLLDNSRTSLVSRAG